MPPCPRPLRNPGENVAQIEHCMERVNRMVGRVDTGNRITPCGDGTYRLIGGEAEGFSRGVTLSGDRGTSWISTSQPSTSA